MGSDMKAFWIAFLAAVAMPAMAQRSVLYDTSTYRLILPDNILGMTFGGTLVTNLAGTGLTISSGVLQVNTSVIATDAEVAAGYQPLDSDLTAVAGLAANGLMARTSAGSVASRTVTGDSEITVTNGDGVSGNPTLAIAAAITRDSELAVYAPLADPTFTGDPKAPTPATDDNDTSIATTAYVQTEMSGLSSGSDPFADWDSWETRTWVFSGNSTTLAIEPGLAFTAIASGTGQLSSGRTELDGRSGVTVRSQSGTTTTSTGGFYSDGGTTLYLGAQALQMKMDVALNRTNGAVYRFGLGDSTTTTEPTDALGLFLTNDTLCGVTISNGIKAITSTYQLQQGTSYRLTLLQTNDYARFVISSNIAGSASVSVFDQSVTGVPLGSGRTLSIQFGGWNTAAANTNGTDYFFMDHMIQRKAK